MGIRAALPPTLTVKPPACSMLDLRDLSSTSATRPASVTVLSCHARGCSSSAPHGKWRHQQQCAATSVHPCGPGVRPVHPPAQRARFAAPFSNSFEFEDDPHGVARASTPPSRLTRVAAKRRRPPGPQAHSRVISCTIWHGWYMYRYCNTGTVS